MKRTFTPLLAAAGLSFAAASPVMADCNVADMDIDTLTTCIAVEGSGQLWPDYQKTMKGLRADIDAWYDKRYGKDSMKAKAAVIKKDRDAHVLSGEVYIAAFGGDRD